MKIHEHCQKQAVFAICILCSLLLPASATAEHRSPNIASSVRYSHFDNYRNTQAGFTNRIGGATRKLVVSATSFDNFLGVIRRHGHINRNLRKAAEWFKYASQDFSRDFARRSYSNDNRRHYDTRELRSAAAEVERTIAANPYRQYQIRQQWHRVRENLRQIDSQIASSNRGYKDYHHCSDDYRSNYNQGFKKYKRHKNKHRLSPRYSPWRDRRY